jgi:UDP-4-amino-4,6-dideoxy-N-acetyl-beta-L-altrosamine N-acetyltransferase
MIDLDYLLRPLAAQDLDRVRHWRNHSEVRRYLYTQHEISAEEHQAWFERARHDADRHLLLYEQHGLPTGFVNLTIVDLAAGRAEWGFYLAPEVPRGSGRALGETALTYAFATLKLHKLCGEALASNDRSIRFHERLGFTREAHLRDHHFDGNNYHDVVGFGLLRCEWQPRQEPEFL